MANASFPILFVAPADTRGAIMGSGLIRILGEEIPNARFTLVVGKEAAPLFSGLETLDALVVLDETHPGRARNALKPYAKGVTWGLTVDLRGIGIAEHIRTLRRAVLKPGKAPAGHMAFEAAKLFALEFPPDPILFPYAEAEARARQLTAGTSPILAIAPLTPWMGAAWPLERYNLVAMRLLSAGGPLEGGRLMVVGTPGVDGRAAEPLTRAIARDRVIDLSTETDIGLMAAALARADLFLSGDVLGAHIAAAAGAPTLTLFGPSDEELNAPAAARARTIRGPRSFEQIREVDRGLKQSISHMMDLRAEPVLAAATALAKAESHVIETGTSEVVDPEPDAAQNAADA